MTQEAHEPTGRTPENEAYYGSENKHDTTHTFPPQRVTAAAEEYAQVYEADNLRFLMGATTQEQRADVLSRFFEISPRYGEFTKGTQEFYNGIIRAKAARSQMNDPEHIDRAVTTAFAGQLDQNPNTSQLLGDVITARLLNPLTPSSGSILTTIDQVRTELGVIPQGTRITTPMVIGRVITGQMRMSQPQAAR